MTVADLAALHAAAFTTPRPWTAAEIAALLASPHCFVLQEPGGFLMGRALAGEAELLTLAVDPARRRQGIGGRLVAGFLAKAADLGAETAFLEVAANNEAAIALYGQAGFAAAGRRRGYYAQPGGGRLDALVLIRPLPDGCPVFDQKIKFLTATPQMSLDHPDGIRTNSRQSPAIGRPESGRRGQGDPCLQDSHQRETSDDPDETLCRGDGCACADGGRCGGRPCDHF